LLNQMVDGFLTARIFDKGQEGALAFWVSIVVLSIISIKVADSLTN